MKRIRIIIPAATIERTKLTNDNMKVLLRKQIDTDMVRLEQCVQNFTRHLADLMPIELQHQQAQFSSTFRW
jgi:type IV secretion system protein VirB4